MAVSRSLFHLSNYIEVVSSVMEIHGHGINIFYKLADQCPMEGILSIY